MAVVWRRPRIQGARDYELLRGTGVAFPSLGTAPTHSVEGQHLSRAWNHTFSLKARQKWPNSTDNARNRGRTGQHRQISAKCDLEFGQIRRPLAEFEPESARLTQNIVPEVAKCAPNSSNSCQLWPIKVSPRLLPRCGPPKGYVGAVPGAPHPAGIFSDRPWPPILGRQMPPCTNRKSELTNPRRSPPFLLLWPRRSICGMGPGATRCPERVSSRISLRNGRARRLAVASLERASAAERKVTSKSRRAPGDPGELRGYPKLPKSCPTTAEQFPRNPRSCQISTSNLPIWATIRPTLAQFDQHLANFDQSLPTEAKFA